MTSPSDIVVDRALGSLVGLAVGDALGTTFEFGPRRPNDAPIAMSGGGPHHLEPGHWTDDTAMALCLADSLIANGGRVRQRDLMTRFARWMTEGHNSCTGTAFDIGWTTRGSISEFIETGNPIAGPTTDDSAGNGGIMRLSPIVMANLGNEELAANSAREQSRTTHGAPHCLSCAEFQARLLHRLIHRPDDVSPYEAVLSARHPVREIAEILRDRRDSRPREEVRTSGFVLHTLEAALWSFVRTETFESALTEAVNLGGDTDTIGAVTGQIAGAAYGLSAIPPEWLRDLAWRDEIIARGRALIAASENRGGASPLRRLIERVTGR